jgi:O-antigen/teichoic acid export membrane protein
LLGKFLTYPFGLAVTLILAKLLTTQEMGGYFLVMSTIMISSILVRAGIDTTMCKLIARSLASGNPRAARKTMKIGLVIFLLTASIAYLFFSGGAGIWLFGQIKGGAQLYDLLGYVGVMVVLFGCIGYGCDILRGFNDLRSAALLDQQALQRFLQLLGLLVIVLTGYAIHLEGALMLTLAAMAVPAGLGILMVTRKYAGLGHGGDSIKTSDVLLHAPPFLLVRISSWVFDGAAIWILSTSRGLEESALYGAANALALLILAPAQVVNGAIGPTLVALHARDKTEDLRNAVRAAAALIAIPALFGAGVLVIFGEIALELLFTEEYRSASILLVVLVVGRAASTFLGIPLTLLSMTHHQNLVFRVLVITSGLTLAAYFYAAQNFGAPGVAWVSAGSILLQGILLSLIARRVLQINTLPRLSITAWRKMIHLLRRED